VPPESLVSIAGVTGELMLELEAIDAMTLIARRASPTLAKAFHPIAEGALAAIQKALPQGMKLASE
jgi:hypothetical protein